MYKITFQLKSAISFIDLPVFDALLAWCYMKEKYGYVDQKLTIVQEEIELFHDLPIKKHDEGYFIASWMQFDETKEIEFTSTWKKRWANKTDHIVNFGKKLKKVMINKGDYKSYDIPIVLHNIKEVWFYFESKNIKEVENLISKHLYGIGKKTSQGYGEIESFEIENIDFNPFEQIIRPIPASSDYILQGGSARMMGYRPPYWLPENQKLCKV